MNRPQATVLVPSRLPARAVRMQNPSQIWAQLTADQRQNVLQVLSRACCLLAKQAREAEGRHER
jgi:hypothetical protein